MEKIHGGWKNVPENLKCKTELKGMGLKAVGQAKAEVWNSYQWVKLYDQAETVERKHPTEKQLQAIEKANAIQKQIRTCPECGEEQPSKFDLVNGLCGGCQYNLQLKAQMERAEQKFLEWDANKEKYIILDTETTGLDEEDEIVEIAVIDLNGTILLNTLIKPTVPIKPAAQNVHGITQADLADAPSFAEIADQLKRVIADKIILTYNADFDRRMVDQSAAVCGLKIPMKTECAMTAYSDFCCSPKWVSLATAIEYEGVHKRQSHRALDDCYLVNGLIQAIVKKGRVSI